MCIFGSVESQTVSTFLFLHIIIFQRGESFDPPSSTLAVDRHMLSGAFLCEIQFWTTFIKLFLIRCVFLAASSPKLYLLSHFCILLFSKKENLSIPLAPLRGEIDICAWVLFCTKFNFEQLLFKALFYATRLFGSVKPQTSCTFQLLYIIVFPRWEPFNPPSSILGGDTHTRSWTFLYKIQFRTTFI